MEAMNGLSLPTSTRARVHYRFVVFTSLKSRRGQHSQQLSENCSRFKPVFTVHTNDYTISHDPMVTQKIGKS